MINHCINSDEEKPGKIPDVHDHEHPEGYNYGPGRRKP